VFTPSGRPIQLNNGLWRSFVAHMTGGPGGRRPPVPARGPSGGETSPPAFDLCAELAFAGGISPRVCDHARDGRRVLKYLDQMVPAETHRLTDPRIRDPSLEHLGRVLGRDDK
jgi:hypothetical protein